MADWHDVGTPADFSEGSAWPVRVGSFAVAVFRLGEELHALADRCTHGMAKLSEGYVEDDCIECPLHQARFDIRTGKPQCGPAVVPVRRFPVRVTAGRVEVHV